MRDPWPSEEIAWARECLRCGDTFEEIAEWSGRTLDDVKAILGSGQWLTPAEREVLSLYTAGCSFREIDATRGARTDGAAFTHKVPGKAASAMITNLRKKGVKIPYRNEVIARKAHERAAA